MTNPSFDVCEISFMLNLLNNRKHNATLKKNVIMVIRILRTFLKVANLNQRVIGIIMSDRFLIYNLFDTKKFTSTWKATRARLFFDRQLLAKNFQSVKSICNKVTSANTGVITSFSYKHVLRITYKYKYLGLEIKVKIFNGPRLHFLCHVGVTWNQIM